MTNDLDQTEDPTHGAQQLSVFNGYYGNWFDLRLLAFPSFNDESEEFLVASVLRPGNAPDRVGAPGLLRRLRPCPVRAARLGQQDSADRLVPTGAHGGSHRLT